MPTTVPCPQCNKSLRKKSRIVKQLNTHTGAPPYQCLQCGKAFMSKEAFVIHRRTHAPKHTFECTCMQCVMQQVVFDEGSSSRSRQPEYAEGRAPLPMYAMQQINYEPNSFSDSSAYAHQRANLLLLRMQQVLLSSLGFDILQKNTHR